MATDQPKRLRNGEMSRSQSSDSEQLIEGLGEDIGYPEGIAPREALASILDLARRVAGGDEVMLVVTSDRLSAFSSRRREDDASVVLGQGLELRSGDRNSLEQIVESLESPERWVLTLPSPAGTLVIAGPERGEALNREARVVVQLLTTYAASTLCWASQLHEAGKRAAAQAAEQQELRKECARLRELSEVDDLTGLYNRRFFKRHLRREVRRYQRYGHSLSLALIDLDHFKAINDTYGHTLGDVALCQFAQIALTTMRESDLIARVGGDEFAVLMPDTPSSGATRAVERLIAAVESSPIEHGGDTVTLAISVGMAGIEDLRSPTPETFLSAADELLYAAKLGGRGRYAVRRSSPISER